MIRISNKHIETPIVLDSASPFVLSIENSKEFFRIVTEIKNAFAGETSEFSFYNESEAISPEKHGEMILSPFYFEFTDKKLINLLYKKLQYNFNQGDFIVGFNEINANVDSFLYDLCATVDFSLEHEELTIESLLKTCSVIPTKTYDTLIEKLVCYVNIFIELKAVSFFVLVGIKDVLSDEDLSLLYKHCEMNKVGLFLIERRTDEKKIKNERKIIITEDLCEIVENIP